MLKVTANSNQVYEIRQEKDALLVNDVPFTWDLQVLSPHTFHILYQNRSFNAEITHTDYETKSFTVRINNRQYQLRVQDQFDLLLEKMGMSQANTAKINHLKAPMPGLILDIKVQAGDQVKKGDALMILEAMKMENIIKSPGEGQVKAIKVRKGDNVEKNQVLIEF